MKDYLTKSFLTFAIATLFFVLLPNASQQVAAATVTDSGSCGDNVTYTLYDDGELIISGNGTMTDYSYTGYAPWDNNRNNIKKVTIESGITNIGDYAFYFCGELSNITIPDSVASIGKRAFIDCNKLISITIPNSVTSIGDEAFQFCSGLTSITIPDSVTSIGEDAFYRCDSVKEIYYAGTAEQWLYLLIKSDNTPLINLTVQCSDGNAEELIQLDSCGNDVYFKLTKSGKLIINGSGAMEDYPDTSRAPWDDNKSSIQTVIIKSGVTRIGISAFWGCSGLPSITIPDSVTSIGNSAFSGCSGLTSITIPNSVTSIGNSAFKNCGGLPNITIPDSVTSIGDSAFKNCGSLTSITIPDSVTQIGESAFETCTNLTDVTIPDSITSIGNYVFFECSRLTSITIPDNVTNIGNYAFSGCSKLTSVTIGNGVTSIGTHAFYECEGLKNLTIGKSIINIDNYAFWRFATLFDVYYLGTQEQWKAIVIGTNNESLVNADIHCSDGVIRTTADTGICGENLVYTRYANGILEISGSGKMTDYSYASPSPWYEKRYYIKKITIKPGITQIGECAFKNCIATSITIPNSVLQIGKSAFENCSELTSITIPDSVTQIGESAFETCTNLTGVTIPDSVTSIGKSAFEYCRGLASITIPHTVTHIDSSAFDECSGLKEVHITDITAWCKIQFGSMDANPLYYAKTLYVNGNLVTELVIPDDVFSISNYAFYNYTGLTNVTIPDSVISIGEKAFYNCANLNKIDIPDSVTLIGDNAFTGCNNLQSIQVDTASKKYSSADGVLFNKDGSTLITFPAGRNGEYSVPAGVTYISEDAFYGVKGITNLVIPEGVKNIGNYAFNGCSGLTNVTLPTSITNVSYNAFANCTGITDVYYNGTAQQWQKIFFGSNNEALTAAIVHCADGAYINGGSCGSYLKWVMYDDGRLVVYKSSNYGSGDMTNWDTPDTVPWKEYRDKITSVTIEEGVTSVGSCAFYGCANITEIFLPSGVTHIGTNAFDSCVGMKRVTLPLSVMEIENRAFRKCDAVTEVVYLGTAEQWSGVTVGTSGNECLTGVQFRPNDYVITYNYMANGGTSSDEQYITAAQGTAVDLTISAVKDGWEFLGWNTDENATAALMTYTVTQNTTLYAIFKRDIKVSFCTAQGEVLSTKSVTIYNKALNGTVTAPEGSGTEFVGWAMGSLGGKIYTANSSITVTGDTVMYAIYEGDEGYPVQVQAKVEPVDGKYRITVTVIGQVEGMTVRAVAYSASNRTLDMKEMDATGDSVMFDTLSYCKVFVWNENMQPLARVIKVNK